MGRTFYKSPFPPTFFDDPDVPFGPSGPPARPEPHEPPSSLGLPSGWPPAPSPAGDREKVGTENTSRERLHPRPSPPEPQLIPIPMSDGEDDDEQPPQGERQRGRSRSRERAHPPVQVPQEPQIQPMVTPEPDDNISDDEFTVINPSSPSAGPPPSAEQRGRSRRDERSRSRERVPPHSSSHASQQPQPVVPPSGVQQTQTLATQGEDEDSATVDPQKRVSDRSRSPQYIKKTHGARVHKNRKERKLLQKSHRVNYRRQRSTSPWIQVRKMKKLKTSLEPPQTLNLLCQYYLFINDQQPVRNDQLPVCQL